MKRPVEPPAPCPELPNDVWRLILKRCDATILLWPLSRNLERVADGVRDKLLMGWALQYWEFFLDDPRDFSAPCYNTVEQLIKKITDAYPKPSHVMQTFHQLVRSPRPTPTLSFYRDVRRLIMLDRFVEKHGNAARSTGLSSSERSVRVATLQRIFLVSRGPRWLVVPFEHYKHAIRTTFEWPHYRVGVEMSVAGTRLCTSMVVDCFDWGQLNAEVATCATPYNRLVWARVVYSEAGAEAIAAYINLLPEMNRVWVETIRRCAEYLGQFCRGPYSGPRLTD